MSKSLKVCIRDISKSYEAISEIADGLHWCGVCGVNLRGNFRLLFEEVSVGPEHDFNQIYSNVKAALAGMLEPDIVKRYNSIFVKDENVKVASMYGIRVGVTVLSTPGKRPVAIDSQDNDTPISEWFLDEGTPDSEWFLDEAKRVQTERSQQYDRSGGQTGERSMARTVVAFNAITDKDITESEGWLLLQLLKDVRQWSNPGEFHLDSAIDSVSYASLKAESLAANK
jgi:hypothetical protein